VIDFPWIPSLLRKYLVFLCMAATLSVSARTGAAEASPPPQLDTATSTLDEPAAARQWDLAEVVKQAAEQPLHFVMSAGPIWLSRCLTAVPWYGWAAVPALAYREWRQWPSKRWWDPALDAAFLMLGVVTATWSARLSPPGARAHGRDWRTALAHLAPGTNRTPLPAEPASS
jgi:hypothetical protein